MLKKLWLIAASVFAAVTLCGCSQMLDLRLRLVVHAIGIDMSEDDTFEVSWQVFSAQPPEGEGPVDATGKNVITVVTYGRTIYEAQNSLELQTGKEIFTGDAELLVFGSNFAGRDISDVISYFSHNSDIYMGMNIAFAEGRAGEVVGVTLEHGTATTELLNEMITAADNDGGTVALKLIAASNSLNTPNESFLMPVLTSKKADNSKGTEGTSILDRVVGVFKSALVINGVPVCYVTSEEGKGVSLLTDNTKSVSMTLEHDGERIAAKADIDKIRRSVEIGENGFPVVKVKISGSIVIKDDPSQHDHSLVRQLAQKELMRFCSLAYSKTAGMYGADVLEVGRLLKRYENEYYRENVDNLPVIVQNTAFNVTINLKEYRKTYRE